MRLKTSPTASLPHRQDVWLLLKNIMIPADAWIKCDFMPSIFKTKQQTTVEVYKEEKSISNAILIVDVLKSLRGCVQRGAFTRLNTAGAQLKTPAQGTAFCSKLNIFQLWELGRTLAPIVGKMHSTSAERKKNVIWWPFLKARRYC